MGNEAPGCFLNKRKRGFFLRQLSLLAMQQCSSIIHVGGILIVFTSKVMCMLYSNNIFMFSSN